MKIIIYLIVVFLLVSSSYAFSTCPYNITGCCDVDNPGAYFVLNDISGIDCLDIDTADVSVDCGTNMVHGSTGQAIRVRYPNVNISNCEIRGGANNVMEITASNVILHDNLIWTTSMDTDLLMVYEGGYNLTVYDNTFQCASITDDNYLIKLYSNYSNFYDNIYDPSATSEGILIDGWYHNFTGVSIDDGEQSAFEVSGNYNRLIDINASTLDLMSFSISGSYNYFDNCYSELSLEDGFKIYGSHNIIKNSYSFADVIGASPGDCGYDLWGINNTVWNSWADSDDSCSFRFTGDYNLINYSGIITETVGSSTGLVKMFGNYNEFIGNWIDVNATSVYLFNTLGNGEIISNNYIYSNKNSFILNKTVVFYTYWDILPELGTPVYPLDNPNPYVAGNYWINSTSSYSQDCADIDHDGFCDDYFDIYGINATDFYPISDGWMCIPDNNYTHLDTDPSNNTVVVGEYISIDPSESYTYDSLSGQNCSIPLGLTFVKWDWTDCDNITHNRWIGQMNDSIYDTCELIGYECDNASSWKTPLNLTSDTACTFSVSAWFMSYYGSYIDLEVETLTFNDGELFADISAEGGTDSNLDFKTCNHYLWDNATVCISSVGSYATSPIATQQPFYTCYDWDYDGDYEDVYLATGESFYTNTTCPNATIHAEIWNSTHCLENDDLKNSSGYWGQGTVKILVGSTAGVYGTETQYINIYSDVADSSHLDPVNIYIYNITNEINLNTSNTTKKGNASLSFNVNVSSISDNIGCIMYDIASPVYNNSIVRYCLWSNLSAVNSTYCNCTGAINNFYDYDAYPRSFKLYLDYNDSRHNFDFIDNSSTQNLGMDYYLTFNRTVIIYLTEDNGCDGYSPEYTLNFDGICADNIWDYGEHPKDYGGKCGTCFDSLLSPLLNETEADYGGQFCGNCSNKGKDKDSIWKLTRSFMDSNTSIKGFFNNTGYGNWMPFNSNWCNNVSGVIAVINAGQSSMLLIIAIILIIVVIIGLILFLFIGRFWIWIGLGLIRKMRKKR